MTFTCIRHKVEDFDKWLEGFNAVVDFRKESGEKSFVVYKDSDDSNIVTVVNEWEDKETAEKFLNSEELKEKMKELGVLEEPTIFFLEEVSKG